MQAAAPAIFVFMGTETFDDRYRGLENWDDARILDAIAEGQVAALKAVASARPAIERAASSAAKILSQGGGRLIYAGAGTPARLGVQDGAELTPTYGWPAERLAFVIAGGEKALLKAVENAEDDEDAARRDMAAVSPEAGDVCIAVSASGRTPYTVAACRAARDAGALTIGISSNDGAALLAAAEYPVFVDSGPEIVGGSTRMNAGTAQKAVLNMISTLVMIRLGHVYDGLMIDVALTNDKLRRRAARMVADIVGCAEDKAARAVEDSGGNLKLAVLMAKGVSAAEAAALLERHDGNLRGALTAVR